MGRVNDLLDRDRERGQIESDNKLAELFGVTRQAVSKWRMGDAYPSDDNITRLAKIAKEAEEYWLIAITAERADEPARSAWERAAKRLASAAIILLAALPHTSKAAPYGYAEPEPGICIMRNAMRLARFLSAKLRELLRNPVARRETFALAWTP